MPFIVEDGTGVDGANSYVSLEYANEYFTLRNRTEWTGTDAVKQGHLISATDYIEAIFGRRFIGEMTDPAQPLSWPRIDTDYAEDEIPDVLKRACCEYACQIIVGGELLPTPTVDASGFSVVTTREAVGPIETEYRVAGSIGRAMTVRSYPKADSLMAGLLLPSSGRVIR